MNISGLDPTKFSGQPLSAIITGLLPYVFAIAGMAMLIYLIFGGYQYLMSRGDPKAIASAQTNITYAIIGFVIVILAYAFVNAIGVTLDLQAFLDVFQ